MSLVGFDVFSREYSLEAISPITAEMSAPDIPQKEVVKRTESVPNCEDLSFFEKLLKLFLPNHVPCVDSESPADTDEDTTADDEMTSYKLSYTISDELSVSYGSEEITTNSTSAEYEMVSASYTAGGMTITASMSDATDIDGTADATEDRERWALSASFAF